MRFLARLIPILMLLTGCAADPAPAQYNTDPYDSGGPLMPEQAAYDVTFYDLDLHVAPADSTIHGTLTATARITSPIAEFVLDLDTLFTVDGVTDELAGGSLPFERRGGKLWIHLPYTRQPGETVSVKVAYGGRPRIAPNPPWSGGFTWAKTASGAPWIATTCQQEGADVWWPVKDHVSDEPDSMALHITVPDPLVVASNGRLKGTRPHDDGTTTYDWFVSTPINAYDVALNIAPYRVIEETFQSVDGTTFPAVFYVLPEDYEKGVARFPEFLRQLHFFEEILGPYPFRADKYGAAQTPHLGMEHQTIIAYGAHFDNGAMTGGHDWGFDALHQHELSHEWWGNLVTNLDWKDMWLHEGFGSYMQPLYLEHIQNPAAYHAYLDSIRPRISNRFPVASRESRSAKQIYGGDIYFKGAWILHTLRHLIGDEAFFKALRRMAYPTPEMETFADGRACRFATTDDFVHLVDDITSQNLDWFFEVYVRQAALPELVTKRDGDKLSLRWKTKNDLPFPMPVDLQLDSEITRVEMSGGHATISVPADAEVIVDPQHWVLRAEDLP